jgi:hypothetical protein
MTNIVSFDLRERWSCGKDSVKAQKKTSQYRDFFDQLFRHSFNEHGIYSS